MRWISLLVAIPRTALTLLTLFLVAFLAALLFNGFFLHYYSLSMLALFGMLLLALYHSYQENQPVVVTPLNLAILGFLGFLAVSLLYHPVTYLGTLNLWWVGVFALVAIIYMLLPDADPSWRYNFRALMLVAAALSCYALLENLLFDAAPDATFYNKNSLAALANLALFPLAATYLSIANRQQLWSATALLLFTFILGVIASRGALLAFGIALMVFTSMVWRQALRSRLYSLGAILAGGLFLASLYVVLHGGGGADPVSRMASLADPESAGNPRFWLWRPAWEIWQENLWTGIGLGAFFLALPAFQGQHDTSAGYYVHNDYLQIATETGLPGLLLLLVLIAVLVWQYASTVRKLRPTYRNQPPTTHHNQHEIHSRQHSRPNSNKYLEATGLFAALLSFGIHSFFTYNFYILPLMIVVGLYIARLNQLYTEQTPRSILRFHWKPHFRPLIFYLASITLVGFAANYFITLALSDYYHQQAQRLAASAQLQQAHFIYEKAQRLSPDMDNHYYANATLLISSAELLDDSDPRRRDLLDLATSKLTVAAELNPYQPYTPYLQGRVAKLKKYDCHMASLYYQQALDKNPRFLPARLALARIYRAEENPAKAFAILEAGLNFPYHSLSVELLDYMQVTIEIARQTEHEELAERLASRHNQFLEAYRLQQRIGGRRPSQRY